jgi:4-amino-4-deoxy-L-arabinose transferase-like glycosyltransferase
MVDISNKIESNRRPLNQIKSRKVIRLKQKRFRIALFAIFILGLVVRITFVSLEAWHPIDWNNGALYHCFAYEMTQGKLYPSLATPTANHGASISCLDFGGYSAQAPPLWPMVLAFFDELGFTTLGWQLIINCIINGLAVPLIGLVAKRVFGRKVGLVSSVIAALYPGMWLVSGMLTVESLATVVTLGAVIMSYRFYERQNISSAVLLGIMCGLSALTRSELFLLAFLLVIPIFVSKHFKFNFRKKLKFASIPVMIMLLMIAPWVIRNNIVFKDFTWTSTDLGLTLGITDCNQVFYASPGATFSLNSPSTEGSYADCNYPIVNGDESQGTASAEHYAFKYVSHNLVRLPAVMVIRLGRMYQLFDPLGEVRFDYNFEQWNYSWDVVKMIVFYFLFPLTLYGIYLAFTKKQFIWPILSLVLLESFTVALFSYDCRFRVVAEEAFCILSAYSLTHFYNSGFTRLFTRNFISNLLEKWKNFMRLVIKFLIEAMT